ncbi:hypothetical protein D3Z58_10255 [Clostridiaceae bacterium]|nr:hypothetical protein [Clostridiaceae bacterium]
MFHRKDRELLYDACICYGNRLSAAGQEINGCPEAAGYLNIRSEEAYCMAQRIADVMSMEEKKGEGSYGVL